MSSSSNRKTKQKVDEKDVITSYAETLASAFQDDPVENYVMGTDMNEFSKQKTSKLIKWFKAVLIKNETKGGLNVASPTTATDNNIPNHHQCVAIWKVPGQDLNISWTDIYTMYEMGVMKTIRELGIMFHNWLNERELKKKIQTDSYYTLVFIGTNKKGHGKGLMSSIMRPILETIDREGKYTYLESTIEENIPIYEHYGFELMKAYYVGGGFLGPRVRMFAMYRKPKNQ
jgi:hypothetical protein